MLQICSTLRRLATFYKAPRGPVLPWTLDTTVDTSDRMGPSSHTGTCSLWTSCPPKTLRGQTVRTSTWSEAQMRRWFLGQGGCWTEATRPHPVSATNGLGAVPRPLSRGAGAQPPGSPSRSQTSLSWQAVVWLPGCEALGQAAHLLWIAMTGTMTLLAGCCDVWPTGWGLLCGSGAPATWVPSPHVRLHGEHPSLLVGERPLSLWRHRCDVVERSWTCARMGGRGLCVFLRVHKHVREPCGRRPHHAVGTHTSAAVAAAPLLLAGVW
ncbi:uncharacterized protein ACIGJ3_004254 [Trichechus inunguis]